MSLTHDADSADDLVQDTLLRGIQNIQSFQLGTNIQAWLMVILRNCFLTQLRARRHEIAYKASLWGKPMASHPDQLGKVEIRELQDALMKIPDGQRRALLLVFGYGYSYAEAAKMCGCPAGTIKSRGNRAHQKLAELMQARGYEFGPDENNLAVATATAFG